MEELLNSIFHIVGTPVLHPSSENVTSIRFTTYSNHSPSENDVIDIGGINFVCYSVIDVTSDEEREEGLSYDEVTLELHEEKESI